MSQLVSVTVPNSRREEFVYDGMSRLRISRSYEWQNGAWVQNAEKRRVYDGMDVVQERDGNNAVTASVTRAGNIGGILARSTPASGTSYFAYDLQGNVTTLTDSAGAVVGSYAYDAWGGVLAMSGARAADNPYRFSTKESLAGMSFFGFRFYDAGNGRWINRDPIQESGGINLYGMVGNDPVNAVDEYGLWKTTEPSTWFDGNGYQGSGLEFSFGDGSGLSKTQKRERRRQADAFMRKDKGFLVLGMLLPGGGKGKVANLTFKNGRYIINNWSKGTFRTVRESAKHHLKKHGNGLDLLAYTRKGVKLWKQSGHLKTPHGLADGSIGWKIKDPDTDWFGIYTYEGKIVTCGPQVR